MNEFDFVDKIDEIGNVKIKLKLPKKIFSSDVTQGDFDDLDECDLEEAYINLNGNKVGWKCRVYSDCDFITDDDEELADHLIEHYYQDSDLYMTLIQVTDGIATEYHDIPYENIEAELKRRLEI